MLAINAPRFSILNEARQWVNVQPLGEVFYLVEAYPSLFEFWSLEDINLSGGLQAFKVIEVWA